MSPEDSFCWEGCAAVGAGRGLSQRPKTRPTARLRELRLPRLSRSDVFPLTVILPNEPAVRHALIISATPLLNPISYPASTVVPNVLPVAFIVDMLSL